MITKERYASLQEEYGKVASWCIWRRPGDAPKSHVGDMSVFDDENLLTVLNTQCVFVGLNASSSHDGYLETERPWFNFHSSSPYGMDYKLRYALLDTPLWGSYITDFLKEYPEVDSKKVLKDIKNHPEVVAANMEIFDKEMKILGGKPTIIALGDSVYDLLRDKVKGKYKIFRMTHFSYSGKDKELLRAEAINLCEDIGLCFDDAKIDSMAREVIDYMKTLKNGTSSCTEMLAYRTFGMEAANIWTLHNKLLSICEKEGVVLDFGKNKNLALGMPYSIEYKIYHNKEGNKAMHDRDLPSGKDANIERENRLRRTDKRTKTEGIWIKFEGQQNENQPANLHRVFMNGKEWFVLNYTNSKRPTSVRDGDEFFMSEGVPDANGKIQQVITGRGHLCGFQSENVSPDSWMEEYPWMADRKWYIIIKDFETLDTSIKYGLPLRDVITRLGSDTYEASYGRNEPLDAVMRKHARRIHLRLSKEAGTFINDEFDKLVERYGSKEYHSEF